MGNLRSDKGTFNLSLVNKECANSKTKVTSSYVGIRKGSSGNSGTAYDLEEVMGFIAEGLKRKVRIRLKELPAVNRKVSTVYVFRMT